MNKLEAAIVKLLVESCKRFVRHGLTHALSEHKTDTDTVQAIINIQAALEVIAKLYQLNNEGWKSIFDCKHHQETEDNLLIQLGQGTLKTHQYWKSRDYIEKRIGFFDHERELIVRFQNYRNSIAHLGLPKLPDDIESDVLLLLLRVINTLNWDESMPAGVDYLENHASIFLGPDIFKRLMKNQTYTGEAVDQAYDHCSVVHPCLECGNESWGETDLDEVLCFACGYKVPMELIGFEDCPACQARKAVVYDKIQGHGVKVSAKCAKCGNKYFLARCEYCGSATTYNTEWACSVCEHA